MARKNSEGFVAVHSIQHTVNGERVETAPGQAYEGEDTERLLAAGAIRVGTAEDADAALSEPGSEATPQARGDEPHGYAAGTISPNAYAAADNAAIAAQAESRPNDDKTDHAPASRSSKTK